MSDVRGVSTCLDAGLDAISLMAALTGAAAEAKLEQLLSKNRYFELAEVRPQAVAAWQCYCIAASLHDSCIALAQVSADPSTCDKRQVHHPARSAPATIPLGTAAVACCAT